VARKISSAGRPAGRPRSGNDDPATGRPCALQIVS